MKLRNKNTGEIITCGAIDTLDLDMKSMGYFRNYGYSSLAELNEVWEDYKEPEDVWYIDWKGDIRVADGGENWDCEKAIGNYFETKEDAEKAVEKLKALKRLKDKGFRFELWDYDGGNDQEKIRTGRILFRVEDDYPEKNIDKDLDLLFGGEDD